MKRIDYIIIIVSLLATIVAIFLIGIDSMLGKIFLAISLGFFSSPFLKWINKIINKKITSGDK